MNEQPTTDLIAYLTGWAEAHYMTLDDLTAYLSGRAHLGWDAITECV